MFGPGYGTGEDVSLINLRLRKEALFCPRHGRLSFGRCPIAAFVAIHFVLRLKNSKDVQHPIAPVIRRKEMGNSSGLAVLVLNER